MCDTDSKVGVGLTRRENALLLYFRLRTHRREHLSGPAMSHRIVPPVTAGLGLSLVMGIAQAAPQAARHPCASIVDDTARLACYDEAFGRPAGAGNAKVVAPTAGVAVAPTAAAAPAAAAAVDPAAKAREEFGLSEAQKWARESPPSAPPAPKSVTGRVVELTRRATGEATVTLDNGQVWTEVEAYSGVVLHNGDVVTIHKASLASYLLVTPKNVATRVRRLK